MTERKRTTTSNFGVGKREAHDAAPFYARFEAPEIATNADVQPVQSVKQQFVCGDARHMDTIADGTVALVVTSPPYFAGKQYEEELTREGIPSSYLEYLELLRDVFAECKRTLEPGGRIAVNVANLGRKPYRSLSADIIKILQDDLHLLLRGEVIWQKSEGASGSCAWGSFRSAANPVLRDITERVIIASKGRFDRALSGKLREARGLPFENSMSSDEFMAATLDVWDIPPESARRVNHPAPFPTALPERLIRLFTYADDLVVDPFMGSGSTLVAAEKVGRRSVGYDLDPKYVEIAKERVAEVREAVPAAPTKRAKKVTAVQKVTPSVDDDFQTRATEEGKASQAIAEKVLTEAGFAITGRDVKIRGLGLTIGFIANDKKGVPWHFDVSGAFTTVKSGLFRTDAVWRALGRASILSKKHTPIVFLTSHRPRRGGEGDAALRAAGPTAFFDVIEILSDDDRKRLATYAKGGRDKKAMTGYWTEADLKKRDE